MSPDHPSHKRGLPAARDVLASIPPVKAGEERTGRKVEQEAAKLIQVAEPAPVLALRVVHELAELLEQRQATAIFPRGSGHAWTEFAPFLDRDAEIRWLSARWPSAPLADRLEDPVKDDAMVGAQIFSDDSVTTRAPPAGCAPL